MKTNSTNSTAVLIFNHSEKQRISINKLAPGISNNALDEIVETLVNQAKAVANESGFPHFQFNAKSSLPFGEQLYEAYQNIFNQGFSTVIGIGNDCPSLTATDILEANHQLQEKDCVFGPAKDGGVYLLGLNKNQIRREDFIQLKWQSDALYQQIVDKLCQWGKNHSSLSIKADMDSVKEFKIAFQSHFQFLIKVRSTIASYCSNFTSIIAFSFFNHTVQSFSLRAPPQV